MNGPALQIEAHTATGDVLDDINLVVVSDAFPAARHAEQGLVRQAVLEPVHETGDGLGLVAGRPIVGLELEWARSVGHEVFAATRLQSGLGRATG